MLFTLVHDLSLNFLFHAWPRLDSRRTSLKKKKKKNMKPFYRKTANAFIPFLVHPSNPRKKTNGKKYHRRKSNPNYRRMFAIRTHQKKNHLQYTAISLCGDWKFSKFDDKKNRTIQSTYCWLRIRDLMNFTLWKSKKNWNQIFLKIFVLPTERKKKIGVGPGIVYDDTHAGSLYWWPSPRLYAKNLKKNNK